MKSIVMAGSACPITKLLTAVLALAITFTLNACEEKKKQEGAATTEPAAAIQQPTQEAAAPAEKPSGSTLTDTRDNKTYKTVKIGEQVWMAENLNYEAKGSKCYDDKPANCTKYGRLYEWATAKTACPSGWKLPSYEEWEILGRTSGDMSDGDCPGCYNTTRLKSKSGWSGSGNGTDDFGFSGLPGGKQNPDGSSAGVGDLGIWWSASEDDSENAYSWFMNSWTEHNDESKDHKLGLFSIRCIQN